MGGELLRSMPAPTRFAFMTRQAFVGVQSFRLHPSLGRAAER